MTPTTATQAWDIDASRFPGEGSEEDRLEFALLYAILAPSGHNTQPWRFRIRGDTVEVHADRMRALAVVDPAGRELVISCGAALFFLRMALRRFHHSAEVALLPEPGEPTLLARLVLGEPAEPTPDETALAEAITRRHTNRQPFEERSVPLAISEALVRAAASEGAWLEPVADRERKHALAALVADAHATQLADDAFLGEMASWIRDPAVVDGMPTHGVPVETAGASRASGFLRTFEAAAGAAASERQLAAGSPLLAVLGTEKDDQAAWLRCGQALGHVLLRACADGLSASFLNQPVEVAALRPHVAEAVGRTGYAHVLLRLGYAPPAPPTPRRPLADVLER